MLVTIYAVAMGLLEAICVVYLRQLLLPRGEEQIEVAAIARFPIELWREACTIIMLATVGWLAGTTVVTRFTQANSHGAPHA